MNDFMKGRNGADELTIVMGFAGIVIAMIGSMARIQWLSWIAIAVIVEGDTPDESYAGGAYAAPVARAILQKWLEKKQRPAAAPKEPIFKPVLSQ